MRRYITLFCVSAMSVLSVVSAFAQEGDEILDKHILAVGTDESWDNIHSIKMIGAMAVQGTEVPISRTCVNEQGMRVDFSIMGVKCYQIITPEAGWSYMPIQPGMDKVVPMTEGELEKAKVLLNIRHLYLADRGQISDVAYGGKENIDGKSCFKLNLTDSQEEKITAYIDEKTYYLIRTEKSVEVPGMGEQKLTVTYGNYKKQKEGIVIPFTELNPMMGGDIEYKEVQINVPQDPLMFIPPVTNDK